MKPTPAEIRFLLDLMKKRVDETIRAKTVQSVRHSSKLLTLQTLEYLTKTTNQ